MQFIQLFISEVIQGAGKEGERGAVQMFGKWEQRQFSVISSTQESTRRLEKAVQSLKSYYTPRARAVQSGEGVTGFLLRANDQP